MKKFVANNLLGLLLAAGLLVAGPAQLLADSNTVLNDFEKGLKADNAGDYSHALQSYQKCVDQGAAAECNIGSMYCQGHGVPQDYHEAMKWFQMSAAKGNPSAECNIGVLFQMGRGVPVNFPEAMKWFRMAAEKGNALAEYKIGSMYSKGNGVPQDYQEALKWYQKAAAQGYAPAQKVIAEIKKILAN